MFEEAGTVLVQFVEGVVEYLCTYHLVLDEGSDVFCLIVSLVGDEAHVVDPLLDVSYYFCKIYFSVNDEQFELLCNF